MKPFKSKDFEGKNGMNLRSRRAAARKANAHSFTKHAIYVITEDQHTIHGECCDSKTDHHSYCQPSTDFLEKWDLK